MSPRIRLPQAILAKCGEVGGLPAELAARRSRYAPPPARLPTAEERDPGAGAAPGKAAAVN
jgi:predicted alpha/beta superfamily hydrolase